MQSSTQPLVYFSLCVERSSFWLYKSSEMCQHVTGSGRCPAIQANINGFLFLLSPSPPTPAYIFPSTLPSFVLPLFSRYLFPCLAILGPTPLCVALSDLSFLHLLTHVRTSLYLLPHTLTGLHTCTVWRQTAHVLDITESEWLFPF